MTSRGSQYLISIGHTSEPGGPRELPAERSLGNSFDLTMPLARNIELGNWQSQITAYRCKYGPRVSFLLRALPFEESFRVDRFENQNAILLRSH
jgi:hypothetical protein